MCADDMLQRGVQYSRGQDDKAHSRSDPVFTVAERSLPWADLVGATPVTRESAASIIQSGLDRAGSIQFDDVDRSVERRDSGVRSMCWQ